MPVWRSIRVFGAVFISSCWLSLPAGASAQLDTQRAQEAERAVSRLIEEVETAGESGDFPRLSEPDIAFLFTTAFDSAMYGPQRLRVRDLPLAINLQQQAKRLVRTYLLAGSGKAESELLKDDYSRELAGRNFVNFLPEIGLAYDFGLVTGARISEVAAALRKSGDAQQTQSNAIASATEKLANSQEGMLSLVLGCSSDTNIQSEWRRDRLVMMNKTAPIYASLLSKKTAQAIADRALAAAIREQDRQIVIELQRFALSILR